MRYFLKKTNPSKNGLYLQIYRTNYVSGKGNQNKSYQVVGYAEDLKAKGITDPIKYAQGLVDKLNENADSKIVRQIGDVSATKNLGYFLLKIMIDELGTDKILDMFTSNKNFNFKMSDFLRSMIYAQVANPGSKLKACENVIPELYERETYSYDQILDAVNSEIETDANEIYKAYHGLWRIEESFRIMKSYLETRPVYLQKEESIYGHFTICYLALTILRLLELKIFNDELPVNQIVEFIRDYRITDTGEGLFINNATKSQTFMIIKEKLGLSKLGNIALKKRDIDSILNAII